MLRLHQQVFFEELTKRVRLWFLVNLRAGLLGSGEGRRVTRTRGLMDYRRQLLCGHHSDGEDWILN